jgi:hypothetical protein
LASPGPIFLAGVDRSGIGLLGELLDAHPSIAISRRTNFWSFFHNRFGSLNERANLDRCIESLASYTRIRALQPRFDEIRAEFEGAADQSYGRLFELIQCRSARQRGKSRWGDKSLDSESHADTIFTEYPSARIVHVIRDPRDRFASQSRHRRAGRGGVGSGTALWLWSARLAQRNRDRYPDQYLVVRFEDLVCDTERCLRSICEFIGEPYSAAMIDAVAEGGPDAGPGDGPETVTSRAARTLRRTGIGRHSCDLSARQIAFIETWSSTAMSRFDYRSAGSLRFRARCRFVVFDLPRWSVGIALWRLQRRGGTRARPSSRRTVAGDV